MTKQKNPLDEVILGKKLRDWNVEELELRLAQEGARLAARLAQERAEIAAAEAQLERLLGKRKRNGKLR